MVERKGTGISLMVKVSFFLFLVLYYHVSYSQLRWDSVDSSFGTLPQSIKVFKSIDSLDRKPNIAYYVSAE